MNTTAETIPTAFRPETSFAVSLHATNEEEVVQANEAFASYHPALPPEDELTPRGIPESALHD